MKTCKALVVATAVVIAFAVMLTSGCSAGAKSELSPSVDPADEAGKQACFANQKAAQAEVMVYISQGNPAPRMTTPGGLVSAGVLSKAPTCPSGGSFVYTPNDAAFTCSIHGWAPGQ